MNDSRLTRGRHPVNIGHLVMGLAFLCFTAGWALVQSDAVTGSDIRWLLPVPWLVAGAAGLVAITLSGLRRHDTPVSPAQPTGWAGSDSTTTSTDPSTDTIRIPEEDS